MKFSKASAWLRIAMFPTVVGLNEKNLRQIYKMFVRDEYPQQIFLPDRVFTNGWLIYRLAIFPISVVTVIISIFVLVLFAGLWVLFLLMLGFSVELYDKFKESKRWWNDTLQIS
jgi:hypothetical protein